LQTLTYTAVLMNWVEADGLKSRFASALLQIDMMFPSRRRVGRTYQGWIKALIRWSPRLLHRIQTHLRSAVCQTAGPYWKTLGWVVLGVDGSKFATPRTAALERALGCSGRGAGGPHVWLTMVLHLATDLPWCWKIGKANASERHHLRAMMHLFPKDTLLVADAGFTGYELWQSLMSAGHSILIRVGANVRLLRKLGYAMREHDGIVYLWPNERCRSGQPPLVLRLIRVHDGRKTLCLITNVLEDARLSDAQVASLYKMRWGLEMYQSYCLHCHRFCDTHGRSLGWVRWAACGWLCQVLGHCFSCMRRSISSASAHRIHRPPAMGNWRPRTQPRRSQL